MAPCSFLWEHVLTVLSARLRAHRLAALTWLLSWRLTALAQEVRHSDYVAVSCRDDNAGSPGAIGCHEGDHAAFSCRHSFLYTAAQLPPHSCRCRPCTLDTVVSQDCSYPLHSIIAIVR